MKEHIQGVTPSGPGLRPSGGARKRSPAKPLVPNAATDWHLLCVTSKGRVSILKNLDLRTARETYKRLRPYEHPVDYKYPDCEACRRRGDYSYAGGYSCSSSDDRLERVEAIGPEGEKLDPWDGVEPRIIDLSKVCRCPKAPAPPPVQLIQPVGVTIFEARALTEAGTL